MLQFHNCHSIRITIIRRYSVGVENEDGTISLWTNCHRQTPLKYFQEIPSDLLFAIENPLSRSNNYRQVGVPATPPQTRRVVQESPTSPSVMKPNAVRDSTSALTIGRLHYRPMSSRTAAGELEWQVSVIQLSCVKSYGDLRWLTRHRRVSVICCSCHVPYLICQVPCAICHVSRFVVWLTHDSWVSVRFLFF